MSILNVRVLFNLSYKAVERGYKVGDFLQSVWQGVVEYDFSYDGHQIAEEMFSLLNYGPFFENGWKNRSMSTGDVVEIVEPGGYTYRYISKDIGWELMGTLDLPMALKPVQPDLRLYKRPADADFTSSEMSGIYSCYPNKIGAIKYIRSLADSKNQYLYSLLEAKHYIDDIWYQIEVEKGGK